MKKGLVLGVYETEKKEENEKINLTPAASKYNEICDGKLLKQIKLAGPQLRKAQTRVFWGLDDSFSAVAVVGLGKQNAGINDLEEIHEGKENVRVAAAAGCRALEAVEIQDISVETFGDAEAAAEGSIISTWIFQEYKAKDKRKTLPKVSLYGNEEEKEWKIGQIKAEAQNWARKLSDTPANLMTPTIFSEEVSKVLKSVGVSVQVHDKAWAENKKMGSFLSVARGSCEEPKFLEISYKGGSDPPIAFVGKGVTFDSGGISLKSSASMSEMRADMAGAACVVAAIKAAAELKLEKNILGLIPLTENLPSGHATKPGDLVVAMNGKTIIVDNTDAEGRLILADALCYAHELNPKFIVDVATLTGAVQIALGSAATGVFSNNTELFEAIKKSGTLSGDRAWRLPLWKYFTDKVAKAEKTADLNNISKSTKAGSCSAAAFLREFVDSKMPWMHLDIAGVMSASDSGHPYIPSGMSGRPTRTIITFLQQVS